MENDRLAALPEIARQFRVLKNESEGVADCLIESAFPMSDAQVAELLAALSKKFGLKLKPEVRVDAGLIGGVRVTVGDHVLDTSVKTRLAQMQAALTALISRSGRASHRERIRSHRERNESRSLQDATQSFRN